ncbi:MAG: phosphoadenylyl-sulfate reductase [Euryarchaeota archaeon]|nr:phosphoadenylyl-sulfate reductase [Euryarchaeota archaeon]
MRSQGASRPPAEEARRLSTELEGKPLPEILEWAVGRFGDRLAIGSSFGKEGLVVLDHLRRIRRDVPVLFLETGYHFPETLAFRDRLIKEWGLNVADLRAAQSVEEQDAEYGKDLFARDPDTCCLNRKVAPLRRALLGYQAWLTGIRRDQHDGRKGTPVVEWQELDPSGRGVFKINPLVGWTKASVEGYIEDHHLPHHPLWDQGYGSIGCAPCTRKLQPGEQERAGRWSGFQKRECGIHLMGKPPPPDPATADPK